MRKCVVRYPSVCVVAILACCAFACYTLLQGVLGKAKNFEDTEDAFVLFFAGSGRPSQIDVRLLDISGKPVAGKEVHFSKFSEGGTCLTDEDGDGTAHVGFTYGIDTVYVEDTGFVLDRSESWFGDLPVKNGLRVLIILKSQVLLRPMEAAPTASVIPSEGVGDEKLERACFGNGKSEKCASRRSPNIPARISFRDSGNTSMRLGFMGTI